MGSMLDGGEANAEQVHERMQERTSTSLRDVCAPTGKGPRAKQKATAGATAAVAIFHFQLQHLGRSSGRCSIAVAAYRHCEKLTDDRTGLVHDYTRKAGGAEVFVLAPDDAPDWVH